MADYFKTAIATAIILAGAGAGYYLGVVRPAAEASAEFAKRQEECRKIAAKVGEEFTSDSPIDSGDRVTAHDWQNRYSEAAGGCLIVKKSYGAMTGNAAWKQRVFVVYDLTGNRRLGAFSASGEAAKEVSECTMLESQCTSLEEWQRLVTPYVGAITP